jgi:hypothetical protein
VKHEEVDDEIISRTFDKARTDNFRILIRKLCRIEFKKKQYGKIVLVCAILLLQESLSTFFLHFIPAVSRDYSILAEPFEENIEEEPIKVMYNQQYPTGGSLNSAFTPDAIMNKISEFQSSLFGGEEVIELVPYTEQYVDLSIDLQLTHFEQAICEERGIEKDCSDDTGHHAIRQLIAVSGYDEYLIYAAELDEEGSDEGEASDDEEEEEEPNLFGSYYFYNYDIEALESVDVSIGVYGDMNAMASLPAHGSAMLQNIVQDAVEIETLQFSLIDYPFRRNMNLVANMKPQVVETFGVALILAIGYV